MSDPCPCCDVTNGLCGPIEAFALGVGLGAAYGQPAVREKMLCPKHRTPYVMAMLKVATTFHAVDSAFGAAQTGGTDR